MLAAARAQLGPRSPERGVSLKPGLLDSGRSLQLVFYLFGFFKIISTCVSFSIFLKPWAAKRSQGVAAGAAVPSRPR